MLFQTVHFLVTSKRHSGYKSPVFSFIHSTLPHSYPLRLEQSLQRACWCQNAWFLPEVYFSSVFHDGIWVIFDCLTNDGVLWRNKWRLASLWGAFCSRLKASWLARLLDYPQWNVDSHLLTFPPHLVSLFPFHPDRPRQSRWHATLLESATW